MEPCQGELNPAESRASVSPHRVQCLLPLSEGSHLWLSTNRRSRSHEWVSSAFHRLCNQTKAVGFHSFLSFFSFRCSVCSRSTERLIQQPADSGSQCSSHYSQFSSDSDGQSRLVCMLFVSRQSRNCQCQCSSFGSSCLKQVKDDFQPVSFALSRFVLCLFFLGLIQLDPSNSDRLICQTNRSSLPLI